MRAGGVLNRRFLDLECVPVASGRRNEAPNERAIGGVEMEFYARLPGSNGKLNGHAGNASAEINLVVLDPIAAISVAYNPKPRFLNSTEGTVTDSSDEVG